MTNHIFFSPHIDDAIFSCGGLILKLLPKEKVLIVNVFCGTDQLKEKGYAQKYLRFCHCRNSKEYFSIRKTEEKALSLKFSFESLFLPFSEALFRSRKRGLSQKYLYNTKKKLFDQVNQHDKALVRKIKESISEIMLKTKNKKVVLYFPLGLGKHVDHQIVNQIGKNFSDQNKKLKNTKIYFYQDFPYELWEDKKKVTLDHKKLFKRENKIFLCQDELDQKKAMINSYPSQVAALFGSKENFEKQFKVYYKNPYEYYWTIK